jgi:hypothetical protein
MNASNIQCRTVPARALKVYNGGTFQKTPNLPILGRSTFSAVPDPKTWKRPSDHFIAAECLSARPANAPVGMPS